MLDAVEKGNRREPMKVGFGTLEQEAALRVAGAERVFDPSDLDFMVKHPGGAVRDGDVFIMVQPGLIKLTELRAILSAADGKGISIQVPGYDPISPSTDEDLTSWRRQKPRDQSIPISENLGRPSKIQYSPQQADAIIREWHAVPKRGRIEIARTAEGILGLAPMTIKPEWVRDLVIKYVGTARRAKPDHWKGISTETDKEQEK